VYSSSASVEDCLVEGGECGGALLGGTSYLYNCTIAGNEPYGIWSWTAVQHIYNTVIFGNIQEGATRDWAGNQPTSESAHFLNCAVTAGSLPVGTFPTLVELVQSDFADAANGNYRPSSGSSLIDAGMADPRGAEASITDLDGSLRTSGTIDIGCYEARKSEMVVHIDGADYSQAHAPAIVTFSHSTDNSASPENIVFTYNFGDGGTNVSTTAATISHEYAAPGVYTVTITADNACDDESATMVYEGYARVESSVVYVTPGNGAGTFPYDTAETGFGNIKTAVQNARDGYTLLLGTGVHETADQVSFTKGITLRGVGATPESVIVRNTHVTPDTYYHRTLEMNNAAGRIENLTIENGCVRNQNGGNLRLVSGVVSNCVIRGGLAVADNGNAAGAAVEISGAGILTHCVISNNLVQGTSNNGSYAGGAIFIAYNAKGSRISNCLVAFNRYETSGDTVKAGAAGIRFGGSNDNTQIENNTVAANTVEGSLSDDSAGIHCTTWYGRLRNNLVIGNYETGKGKYTAVRMDVEHGTYTNNLTDENATTAVFKEFAAGDFRLNASGKANNAGSTAGLALLPSVDLAGNPRIFGSAIDAGCYECQSHARTMIILR
jgi:PKD repeat protein